MNSRNITIGVDGGSTGTTFAILDNETKQVLIESSGASSNKNSVGSEKAKTVISEGIQQALKECNKTLDDVSAVCLGMSGVDRPNDIAEVRSWMEELFGIATTSDNDSGVWPKIFIFNDAVAAICSGTLGILDDVICLIAGTGSICLGTNNSGSSYIRTGGWGPLLGDRGSGFWLGSRVLLSAVDSVDQYGEETVLADLVKQELNLKEMSELIPYVYKDKEWSRIAQFAPLAFKAISEHSDKVAARIVEEMVGDLHRLVETTATKLQFNHKFKLVYCGSILTHQDSIVCKQLSAKLKGKYGDLIEIIETPKVDPAVGSALYYLNNKIDI